MELVVFSVRGEIKVVRVLYKINVKYFYSRENVMFKRIVMFILIIFLIFLFYENKF